MRSRACRVNGLVCRVASSGGFRKNINSKSSAICCIALECWLISHLNITFGIFSDNARCKIDSYYHLNKSEFTRQMHFLTSSVNLSGGGGSWPSTNPGKHCSNGLEPRDCAHDVKCPSHSELSDWAMVNGAEIAERKSREIILYFDKLVSGSP
jgi:hypothetical protein